MKILAIVALSASLALPALARDSTDVPPLFGSISGIKPTLRSNPLVGAIRYGGQSIRFEDTELAKLAERLDVEVRHSGQGDKALDWICFTDTARQTRLWFTADDYSDGAVDGATLLYLPKARATDDCPEAPGGGKISLPDGVALGMSERDLTSRVGAPSYSHEGLLGFFYGGALSQEDLSGYRASELWAAVGGGKVQALGLHQATHG